MASDYQFNTLDISTDSNGLAVVTINRPKSLNALNAEVITELDTLFASIEEDEDVAGIILTGAGDKAFVAGADIRQFTALDAESGQAFARRGQAVFTQIEQLRKPVIAAVNGFALGGGCELALACHLRFASSNAQFGQPEVNLGILPGYGGSQRLPRIVGKGLAMEMILTGEMVGAARAYEIGLVNRVSSPESLLDEARAMMSTILSKAPLAIGYSIEAVNCSDRPMKEGMQREASLFGMACSTDDFTEGASAFLEKRAPVFKGT